MKLTDDEVRKMAEEAGFYAVDFWWRYNVPNFRKFLKNVARRLPEMSPNDASFGLSNEESWSWACGWNSARENLFESD